MKKLPVLYFFLILALFLHSKSDYRFLNLGIIYPLSSNRSKQQPVNINLALLQNSVGHVKGVNMCGFSSISWGNVQGLQSSFFYSQVNGDHKGASFSTLNFINNDFIGAQLGLAANMTGRSGKGAQSAGVINFVGGYFSGYQQSAVYNVVGKAFKGAQFAGIGNAVGENFSGLQYGVIFNFTARQFKGLQWSGVNVAGQLEGLQLGYINLAQKNHGCQIGILNIAEEQAGFPIGLINLSDEGNVQWLNYVSSFSEFNTGVRFLSGRAVSSIELGGGVRDWDYDESAILGFHYGYRYPWQKFGLEAGFGYFHIFSWLNENDEEYYNNLALDFRIALDYQVISWLGVIGGYGSSTITAYEENAEVEVRDLWFLGITLF